MGFENIFQSFKKPPLTIQYSAGGSVRSLIQVEVTRNETYTMASAATKHPVEDGSEISDHIIKNGRKLAIAGTVSDTPITLSQAALGDIAGVVGSAIKGAAGTVATAGTIALGGRLLNATAGKPSKTAFDIFNEIYEEQPLLTIVTGLTTWTNMVMESFSADRNPANANALVFSAEFSEIKIVTSQIVAGGVPADARDAGVQDLTAGEKQAGKQQAGPVANDSQRQTATSWLYQIVGGE